LTMTPHRRGSRKMSAQDQQDAVDSITSNQPGLISGYEPDRRLNGWTRPFDTAANLLEDEYELPEDATWPVWADYPEGTGFHQARGFYVHPGIVRLVREHEEAQAGK
ncbi:hypothetical protein M1L58_22925, partial [Gordonia sp. C13]|nr:hypothetical protein [Gordonia sp. C13]